MVIYKITNIITGKIYIGKDSKNDSQYYGSGLLINRSIKKYGKKNFKKEILEYCEAGDTLNDREKYWIKFYNSTDRNIGYNLTDGGDGGDTIKYLPNKLDIIEKRAIAIKKTVNTPEGIKKRSDIAKKMWSNPKHRKVMSEKMIGRKISWNKKISKQLKKHYNVHGRKSMSERTKRKISEASTGKLDKLLSEKDIDKIIKLYSAGNGPNKIESFFDKKISKFLIRRTLKEKNLHVNYAKGIPREKLYTFNVYKINHSGKIIRINRLNKFCNEHKIDRNTLRRSTNNNYKIVLRYKLRLSLTRKQYADICSKNNVNKYIHTVNKDKIKIINENRFK